MRQSSESSCYGSYGKLSKNVFSSVPFKKFELPNPPTYNCTENWLHRKCSFCLFKIAGRASVVESHFRKVTETTFCNSVEKFTTCIAEISRSSPLTGVAVLQHTVCDATKNELLNLFKLLWNLQKIPSKWSLTGFLFRNLQTCKLQLLVLRVFNS